jgi:hypothetical protein
MRSSLNELSIYAGDPKSNPTKASAVRAKGGGPFAVLKVCGLQFKQAASMAKSGFNSFSADVPAKALFFAFNKVYTRIKVER